MKKILYFSHGLSANGIETFLVNVLDGVDKSKYDITVVIAIDEGVDCLHEQRVLDMGVRVIHAGDLDSMKKKLGYIKNVKRLLSAEKFDVAHSNMDLLNGVTLTLAAKAKIKKRVCHAHTTKSQYNTDGSKPFYLELAQKLYYRLMKKLMARASTDLLACSDAAGEYFYPGRYFKVIYNGINLKSFKPDKAFDRDEYSKLAGLKQSKKRIISVGRISAPKNPQLALEIAGELKKLRNDFEYVWVGTGELEQQVKESAERAGLSETVTFTGVRKDIPQLLNCCDCFLMTSLFEGLPFSLVEAQAAGIRCVVSDAVTEAADLGAVTYVSLEKTPAEWAEIINAELDKPAPETDKEKLELFDIKNTVNQLEEIYNAD